jgi:hypothetical protein
VSEVGALIVRLQAETAQFREDMGKVKSDLADLKGGADQAGEGIATSMTKARGGLMLAEDAAGVRLPRALNTLLAGIPGVGAAFSAMLPVVGVLAAIEVVSKLAERHAALAAALRKANIEMEDAAFKGKDEAKALELTNLKLDDQIAKLEHKPAKNYMKEAILETSIAIDALASRYATDFAKMDEYLVQQTGMWERLKRLMSMHAGEEGGTGAGTQAIWDEQAAVEKLTDARRKMQDAPMDKASQKAAMQALAAAYNEVAAKADAATHLMSLGNETIARFKTEALDADSAAKALALTIEEGSKKKIVAGLEQGKEDLQPLQDKAAIQKILAATTEQHALAVIKLAHSNAELAIAQSKGGADDSADQRAAQQKAAIDAELTADLAANAASMAAKTRVYQAELSAAGNNAEKKKELDATYAGEVQRNADEVVQLNQTAFNKIVEADRTAAHERMAIAKSLYEATNDEAMKSALEQAKITEKAAEQAAKNAEALHQRTSAQTLQAMVTARQAETTAEVSAYQTRLNNLDKFDKDYLKKVSELNKQISDATKKGDADVNALNTSSQQQQLMTVKSAQDKMADAIAGDIAKSIVMNKSLAASFRETGEQMAEQMIKNLLIAELTGNRQKLIDAKVAAADSYKWGASWGGPIAGGVAAAAAFAGVMSFETGGKIPGSAVGSAGAVPIIGHQGETIVTKALTDRVEASERGGGSGGASHNITYAPQIHAVDATGVDAMLSKHSSIFQRHITATLRRMNK